MEDVKLWMPLYTGDYLKDTLGLSKAQHGSYLLAIMKYWNKGESLTREELREVCGRDLNRVCQFFVWEGNRWHHKRIDEELTKARKRKEIAREKAQKGVEARRLKGQI